MFFGAIGKKRHWLRHFDFSSETAERNSTKLDRKQDLNILFRVCVFVRSVNKNSALADSSKMAHLLRCTYVFLWASCFYNFCRTFGPALQHRNVRLSDRSDEFRHHWDRVNKLYADSHVTVIFGWKWLRLQQCPPNSSYRQDKYVIGPICLISSHTIKAPYKSLRQALIRWLCHLWYIV